jgi:hypothetical protein
MFGGVVEGGDGGGETVLSCICYEVGVCKGFRRVRLVKPCGERPCSLP